MAFDLSTEVLTKEGWKTKNDIKSDDYIATFNISKGFVEYQPLEKVITNNYSGKRVIIEGKNIDGVFDDKQVCLIKQGDKFIGKYALNISDKHLIPICGKTNIPDADIEDNSIRLLVQIAADGTVERGLVRFHIKKERKIKRLTALLKEMNIDYTINKQSDASVKINMHIPDILEGYRIKSLDSKLLDLSSRQVEVLVEEYINTDGNMTSQNSFQITTSRQEEADVLQHILVTNGYSCNMVLRTRKSKKQNTSYILSGNVKSTCKVTSVSVKGTTKEGGWNVVVPNKTVFIRRNGLVQITGGNYE
jgi:intein/homing endonuclease